MNKSEAAKYLGMSVRTLERYSAEGRLQSQRVRTRTGPALDFEEAELARFKAVLASGLPLDVSPIEASTQATSKAPQGPTKGQGEASTSLARVEPQALVASEREASSRQVLVPVEALASLAAALGEAQAVVAASPRVSTAEKLLLDLAEASALSGLSRGHLRAAIDSDELRAKRIGRGWKMLRSDLLKYLEGLLQ